MSSNSVQPCIKLKAAQAAPSGASVKRRPGFDYIHRVDSPHEQSVVEAGYPWVRTNVLKAWRKQIQDKGHPGDAEVINKRPHSLNLHSHHGRNTHFLVTGDLTLDRESFHNSDYQEKTIKLHDGVTYPKPWWWYLLFGMPTKNLEAPVGPGDIYRGTTEYDCAFVEGHRCLSPTTAARYMDRGTLTWFDRSNRPASMQDLDYIRKQLAQATFERDATGRYLHVVMPGPENLAGDLEAWFQQEWVGEDLRLMPSVPHKPYCTGRSPVKAGHQPVQKKPQAQIVASLHSYCWYLFFIVFPLVSSVLWLSLYLSG